MMRIHWTVLAALAMLLAAALAALYAPAGPARVQAPASGRIFPPSFTVAFLGGPASTRGYTCSMVYAGRGGEIAGEVCRLSGTS